MAKRTTISIRYEIAQNVRSWILKRKYTVKDLANKTDIVTLPRKSGEKVWNVFHKGNDESKCSGMQ